jgi:membrane-associated phospholipid phosphatase
MSRTLPFISRRSTLIVFAITIMMVGATIFAMMAHSVLNHDDFTRVDTPLLDILYAHRSPMLTTVMVTITNLLAPVTFALIVSIGCALWVWRTRELWRPFVLMASMAVAMAASTLFKHLFERIRPPHAVMIAPFELDYSFPSGHTLGIAVFVLVLGYLLYSRRLQLHHAAIWAIGGALMIVLVAFSRLYLGYHWLTDVTASVGLSLVILGFVIIIDRYAPHRFTSWALSRRSK